MTRKKNGETKHEEKPERLRLTLAPDQVEVRIGGDEGEIVVIPKAERAFQYVHNGESYFHKREDADGRWVYESTNA